MKLVDRLHDLLKGVRTGCVEKIELTFGSAGHQVVTIGGERYSMWLDWKEFPKYGTVVRHKPYWFPYRSGRMLCTSILSVVSSPPSDGL